MTQHEPLNTVPMPVKLRVEDYLQLDETGAFDGYSKTELLDGQVYFMNAQHRPHARVKSRLYVLLCEAIRGLDIRLEALVEVSVSNPPHNAPEPDIVVTSEPDGTGLVPVESIALIVEVADTTLGSDRTTKLRIYASAGITEYWIVDVNGRSIYQYWGAEDEDYRESASVTFGEPITSVAIANLVIATANLD